MTGPERDELDLLIEEQAGAALPSEDALESVNPWYTPMLYITWGLILNGITLHFLYLQYLLPTLGTVLSYLGFRSLRGNGKAFRLAWVISLAELIWHGSYMALAATPWLPQGDLVYGLAAAATAARLIQLLALRSGLHAVMRKAGTEPQSDPLKSAAIWQAAVLALAFTPLAHSTLAGVVGVIAFIVIVRALFRFSGGLERAGYCFEAAPVCISGGKMAWGYLLCCVLAVVGSSMLANHLPPDAAVRPENGLAGERQALQALGMPAETVDDLSDAHVKALEGAFHFSYSQDLLRFGSDYGSENIYDGTNTPEKPPVVSAYAGKPDTMLATSSYIELPGYRVAVLVQFDWGQTGTAYWGDAFTMVGDGDRGNELVGGALLYEKDGQRYTAPIPRLDNGMVTVSDWMMGERTSQMISGSVSYPFGAERQRGYVLYIMQMDTDRAYGGTLMNYYHARQPVVLPYRGPAERVAGWTGENMQQHYSNFRTEEGRRWEAEQAAQ
ncbi:MAG: hypothetical protein ACOYIE_03465 [Agathobaculum sp.]|jgi:hypothetical protein|uniref:hypothetical protein n=1 Tax=Agathobaculum sp. TaxID=2048138 RepID=UPI003D8A8995